MRDGLIELIKKADDEYMDICDRCDKDGYKSYPQYEEFIADRILANGVIVPPCKVGDTVWFELYGQIESAIIYHCTYELTRKGCLLSGAYAKDTRGIELSFNANSIWKAVFLTREEAEQALKGEHHAEIH